jgi:hypothetical protein
MGAIEYAGTVAVSLTLGQVAGTWPAGTTSVELTATSNKACTVKMDTSQGTAYASMPTTWDSTGGTTHSHTVTGLTNGNSYVYYVSGEAGGTEYQCSVEYGEYHTVGIGNITSINREDDLGAITGLAYDITDVNLYGDALNNWQCLTYSWSWKLEAGDSWTEEITDADCNKNEWDFNDVSTIRARYTKLETVGPALGTQIREYQVIGSSVGQDPPAAGAIVDKMQMLYDPSKGLEVLHNANKGLTITR